jgi:hypothetical protein
VNIETYDAISESVPEDTTNYDYIFLSMTSAQRRRIWLDPNSRSEPSSDLKRTIHPNNSCGYGRVLPVRELEDASFDQIQKTSSAKINRSVRPFRTQVRNLFIADVSTRVGGSIIRCEVSRAARTG